MLIDLSKWRQITRVTALALALSSMAFGTASADDLLKDLIGAREASRAMHMRGTDEGWMAWTTYDETNRDVDRPSAEVMESITVHWEAPVLDAMGNFCTVRGQVLYQPEGDDDLRAVDWFQGITLYVEPLAGVQPDWSAGVERDNPVRQYGILPRSGEFSYSFDLRDLVDDRALNESHQFGFSLATHTDQSDGAEAVEWTTWAPVLPGTVEMLEIPAAPEMSRELELINLAARWPGPESNGVELIRAVNALQRLGKDQALATLEEYMVRTNNFDYIFEREIVFWIIRLLFEPIRTDDRIPAPSIALRLVDRYGDEVINWPLNPAASLGDVPFMPGHTIFIQGATEHPGWDVEWAARHGVLRDEPLCPTMNPLVAADALLQSPQLIRVCGAANKDAIRQLREQAMAMVADLLPPIVTEDPYDEAAKDRQWRERVAQSIELGIIWDAERQEFVIPESN
jgi:hypothetical protein